MTLRLMKARLQRAPEGFLDSHQIAAVQAGRRNFLRTAFLAAAASAVPAYARATGKADPIAAATAEGDPAILKLPPHSTGRVGGISIRTSTG